MELKNAKRSCNLLENAVSAMLELYFSRKLSLNFTYCTYNKSKPKSKVKQIISHPPVISMNVFSLTTFKSLQKNDP